MPDMPSIHLKAIPKNLFDIILDKQTAERKKKGQKINLSQAVLMLLKEAYLKEKS